MGDLTSRIETRSCDINGQYYSRTPIYVIMDGQCYNYGTHLNELPNYVNLNQFFGFLYPDMNSIFVISFFFLNSFLVLIFFEYNISLLRQLVRGLSYLFIFNLILFSIWLLAINTSSKQIVRVTEFFTSYLDRLLIWFRYLIMYNETTRFTAACVRFFAFYYVYINPWLLLVNYSLICVFFYIHTRFIFKLAYSRSILPIMAKPVDSRSNRVINKLTQA